MYEEVKKFWETCGPDYAHLSDSTKHKKIDLQKEYKRLILNHLPRSLNGLSVIDYGPGGGFLGELLFTQYGIKKYIAVDIAKRSLDTARTRLMGKAGVFHLVPVNFSGLHADAFFSFACIQHFPSKTYLEDFLANLNSSGVRLVGLHFRSGPKTVTSNNYKVTNGNIGLCCRTTANFIESRLDKFVSYYVSPIYEGSEAQSVVLVAK